MAQLVILLVAQLVIELGLATLALSWEAVLDEHLAGVLAHWLDY